MRYHSTAQFVKLDFCKKIFIYTHISIGNPIAIPIRFFARAHKMKMNREQIYWIFVITFLTSFGAFELFHLINTFINDSIATKLSTLRIDSRILTENLGITLCNTLRPNITYLNERNISENLFYYALSFVTNDISQISITGDPIVLRFELTNALGENITVRSLKRFFELAAMQQETHFALPDEEPLP